MGEGRGEGGSVNSEKEFTFRELQELAIVLEVDVRLAERLGVEASERSKRLLEKINRLILDRAKEMNLGGQK